MQRWDKICEHGDVEQFSTEVCNPTVNPENNHLNGYGYDAAGNVTLDAEGRSFVYDAENKQRRVYQNGQLVGEYFYDGDGRRVKKRVYEGGVLLEETVFVYDGFGKLVAEYSTLVEGVESARVNYLTQDNLESPRINTDRDGRVVARHDYMPFGEEIFTAQRTVGLGYTADAVRQKFTGYERDSESGLDYAKARMFSYNHGRFTSPDPLAASAIPSCPQSWNRYSYSYNNPLRFTDPSGMLPGDYYDENGNYLGTDGKNDSKIYVVTNKEERKQIQNATKQGKTISSESVKSAVLIPSQYIRQQIQAALERSNSPTSDDKQGGFHEEGGIWGPSVEDGSELFIPAASGPASDPLKDEHASISLTNFANPEDAGKLAGISGTVHIHPAGVKSEGTTSQTKLRETVIGSGTEKTGRFVQEPSQRDFQVARQLGSSYNIVVGARDKKVYIYDQTRVLLKMDYDKFVKIGVKK